jgi:hypothetical protein
LGTYYTIGEQGDVLVSGARPVEPRFTDNAHIQDTIAHGVLMLGGSFADSPVDPLISRIVTEATTSNVEPPYPTQQWYPPQVGTLNRFLAIDGQSRERLVVVPGQFKATNTTTPTVGIQRLYSSLDFEIYHAPFTATDFIAPSIWQVEAISNSVMLQFRVQEDDNSGDPAGPRAKWDMWMGLSNTLSRPWTRRATSPSRSITATRSRAQSLA